jgi:hypothetical protein
MDLKILLVKIQEVKIVIMKIKMDNSEITQIKQKRHRRTKAEMELVREIDVQPEVDQHEIENNQTKQKRHRRTKAEMELVRVIDTPELKVEKNKRSNVNELVKLKFDHKGIPKDTILEVIETPKNQADDDFFIWIKYNDIIHRILKFNVFFVR